MGAAERSSAAGGRHGEEGAAAGEALTADGVEGGLGPPLEALAQLQRVLLLVQQRVRRAVHGPAPGPAGPFPLFRALPPGVLPEILDFPFRETSPGLAAGTAGRGGGPGPGWGCYPGEGPWGGGSPALPALGRAEQSRAEKEVLSFTSLPRYPSSGHAGAGGARGKPVPCGGTGGSHSGVTCLWP